MLDKNGIIKRLLKADIAAKETLKVLKGLETPTLLDYQTHIRMYILYKFLLDDEPEILTDRLNELADLSVQKAGRLNPNESILLDVSKHCGATSSSMTKKVLLFMSLQEDFSIQFGTIPTADIDTTAELAGIVYQLYTKKGEQKSEL